MPVAKDKVGMKFGLLTVISRDTVNSKPGREYVIVKCKCGVEKTTRFDSLTMGVTKTCGCGKKLHGLVHGHNKIDKRSPEYTSWDSMVQRCTNPKHPVFDDYGGRGLTVCERWLSFNNFLSDMGVKPSVKFSIERIDNNMGYFKENCRWATQAEQMRNTRRTRNITVLGVTKCLSDWVAEIGIDRRTVISRLNKGWTESSAILTPTRKAKLI